MGYKERKKTRGKETALKHPITVKKEADKLLEDWDDVCTALNIPHFLTLGTCLGFYRDKGYIKGDCDLDVGVLCNPPRVEELAGVLLSEKGIHDGGRLFANINFGRDGILLDVWHTFGPLHNKYFEKFDTVIYEGRTYNVPFPIEGYLEFIYVDWKTPTEYDAKAADGTWLGKPQRSAVDYTNKGPVPR